MAKAVTTYGSKEGIIFGMIFGTVETVPLLNGNRHGGRWLRNRSLAVHGRPGCTIAALIMGTPTMALHGKPGQGVDRFSL
jgi:hypothetical protein